VTPLDMPLDILRPGGMRIVAAECREGLGSAHFRQAQARLVAKGPDAFLAKLMAKPLADRDEWQTEMQLKPMRAGRIRLLTTGLAAEDLALTGVEPVADLTEAVASSGDPDIAVISEEPYVVPLARAARAA
jgi:hypothetical protein